MLHGAGQRVDQEQIACQDAHPVAPKAARSWRATAQRRIVDHVVVKQRRGMDQFGDDGQLPRSRCDGAETGGAQEQRDRPDSLTAARHEVLGRERSWAFPASDGPAELGLDPGEIVREQRLDFPEPVVESSLSGVVARARARGLGGRAVTDGCVAE
jgi:hypothetical protein